MRRACSLLAGLLLVAGLPATVLADYRPNPPSGPFPAGSAAITSPVAGAVVNGVVTIVGTATLPSNPPYGFQFYKVEWGAGTNPQTFNTISTTYLKPVANDVLDRWDTTGLPDGQYLIRLSVVDTTGNFTTASVPVIVRQGGPVINPTPVPAPPPAQAAPTTSEAGATVRLLPGANYTNAFGFFTIVGEVQNTGQVPAGSIVVLANFLDTTGKVVGTAAGTSLVDVLVPGQKAPYMIQRLPDPSIPSLANYKLDVSVVRADPPLPTQLALFGERERVDPNQQPFAGPASFNGAPPPLRRVSGQVHNAASTPSGAVKIVGTFYDANGAVVRVGVGYLTAPATSIPPGGDGQWDLSVPDTPGIATYVVQVG